MRLVYAPPAGHRQLRRRDRQLALAAAHRRLVVLPRLRRQGRQAGDLLEGQRALQARALAARAARGREGRRPRLRGRLPRAHAAPPDLRRGEGDDRVDASRASSRAAEEQIAILEALGKTDPELQIKAAGRVRGLNNSLTNRRGQLEGLVKGGILAKKEQNEKELAAWIAADPARQKEYGDVLPALAALQAEAEKTRERDAALRRALHVVLDAERGPLGPPALGREGEEERHGPRARVPGAQLDADPRGPGAGAAHASTPRIDKALLRVGDGPRGGAARRPADHRPRQARGPHPGHGEGRLRQGDRRLPRRSCSRARSWPTRTSAWASSTRRRPRSPPRRTRWSTSRSRSTRSTSRTARSRRSAQGADVADPPPLHAGPPRARRAAWSRPTRTARCASPSAR